MGWARVYCLVYCTNSNKNYYYDFGVRCVLFISSLALACFYTTVLKFLMGVNVLHLNFAKGSPDKNNQLLSVGKVNKSYKYF
jgi:hypothetical protein